MYLKAAAEELDETDGAVRKYRFTPTEVWINDEAKNEDSSYKHDIRILLDFEALKAAFA